MAYVLAEMFDLAYYQFEGQRGFVDDAVENAMSLDLTDDTNVREFLEKFSTELMSRRRLQLGSMKKVLSNSGFSLLDVIDINETQGFACKRIAENEPTYLVLAFRGTEKKIPDWLTDARCVCFLKTPVYRIVNSSDIVPRVPPGAVMMGLVLLVQGISWLTRFAPPISAAFDKLEEFLDKLNGYRHFGDLRYLSDVTEGRFDTVRLLSNPPAIDPPQSAPSRRAAVRASPRRRARGCRARCARRPRVPRRAPRAEAPTGRGCPRAGRSRRRPRLRLASQQRRARPLPDPAIRGLEHDLDAVHDAFDRFGRWGEGVARTGVHREGLGHDSSLFGACKIRSVGAGWTQRKVQRRGGNPTRRSRQLAVREMSVRARARWGRVSDVKGPESGEMGEREE